MRITVSLLLAAAALAPVPTLAQTYPSKPVRMIVPFPPGGGFDGISRPFGERLGSMLGQPVVIENRAGAGGNIGAELAARAPADGYTLLFANTFLTTNPAIYKSLNYDPIKDFAPISRVGATNTAISVHPSVPARDLKELIAYSFTKTLNYGTPGVGTMPHLVGEMLNLEGTMRLQHIPYKGTGLAINDVLGGQIDMVIVPMSAVAQHIRAGKLRGIAVLSPKRASIMPELPSLMEQGVPIQGVTWYALFAPAATPVPVIRRLNEAAVQVLAQSDVIERLRGAGYEPESSTPEALAERLRTEIQMWQRVVVQAKIPRE